MPTPTNNIAARVRAIALQGTSNNSRGLPPVLSDLVVAQSKHESGNYTSNVFKKNSNAFGYAYTPNSQYQIGPGVVADNGQPVGDYADVEDSTREIVDWIYRRVREGRFPVNLSDITTPERYAELLKNAGYYGDSLAHYAAGLRRYYSGNNEPAGAAEYGTGAGLLALAGVLTYVFFRDDIQRAGRKFKKLMSKKR